MPVEGTGIGEGPATGGFHGMGGTGLNLKKKLLPKVAPKKLKENKGWKKSFKVFTGKMTGKKGS
jgi:hypothetical protein